jgi:biopolymer transport protein ExbB/TolQ
MEHGRSDNVDLVKALFLGAVLTAFFYEIFPIPFLDQGRVLALFDNQVSEAIVGMTFWSLFLLLFKYLRHRVQGKARQSFLHPRVRALLGQPIYARDVDRIVGQLKETMSTLRVKHFERSIIYRRVVRVLHFVRTAPKKEGVNDLLDYQAQIDLKRLETSYAIVQVFIWAIPILGFIGTVMGIGSSVGEFAGFIQTAESGAQFGAQMRGALSGVTSGLAVAFNTTFLALVLVIPVMMLTSFLQKTEEEFLLGIEEYCLEELQPHLRVNPGEDALAEGYEEHLHRILRLSDTWLGQFEPLVERLSRQTELISAQMAGLPPLVKDFTDRLLTREEDPPPAGRLASRAAEPPTSTGAELPIGEEERQQDS